ncbi:MAG TPA: DUF4157 domain-containing protein [Thermoanaerobaculia bacterium]|jgi:soluble lytic murein transglycosylase-like protein|nr:DUF4157 domain-containing protein [Thermoanaerobaculia bacterium]
MLARTRRPYPHELSSTHLRAALGRRGDSAEAEAHRTAEAMSRGGVLPVSIRALPSAASAAHDIDLGGPGEPLSGSMQADLAGRFGHDFSQIRVHADPAAARAAEDLGARAFTVYPHIAFAEGRFAPGTLEGNRLLAHELTHAVQQERAGGPAIVQCDADADLLKAVQSDDVQMRQDEVDKLESQLATRLAKRRAEIETLMKETKSADRKAQLQKDLDKSVAEIIAKKDSSLVDRTHRKDIKDSFQHLKASKGSLATAAAKWAELDDVFLSSDVKSTLASIGLTPADLKATIWKESNFKNNTSGDIAGIAQIGIKEEKRAGGKPDDRKNPKRAIHLLAHVLKNKADDLKSTLKKVPGGMEWKRFLLAAYNAGVFAIADAQQAAIAMGRAGTTWAELIDGDGASPLQQGLEKHKSSYPEGVDTKLKTTKAYVADILARVPLP